MRRTRSEGKSRFWLFGGHEFLASLQAFFVCNLLIGSLIVGGLVYLTYSGIEALEALGDPSQPLNALRRPLTAAEAATGRVRISGTLDASKASLPPLCLITYEVDWQEVFRRTVGPSARIRTAPVTAIGAAGATSGPSWRIDPDSVRWMPVDLSRSDAHESSWQALFPELRGGGRIYERCLARGDPVFVEGCTAPGEVPTIGACPDGPAVITPGDGTVQPRLDALASQALGRLSWLAASLLALLIYGWRLVRRRTLPRALIRWHGSEAEDAEQRRWPSILGGAPLAALLGYGLDRWWELGLLPEGTRLGYVFAGGVGCLLLVLLNQLRHRQALLQRATAPLIAAPPVGLAQAGHTGEVVQLAVRVSQDAPTVLGPLSKQPRACYQLLVDLISHMEKDQGCIRVHQQLVPEQIPVEDSSGKGLLDLREAVMDLRALQRFVRRGALEQGALEHVPGEAPWEQTEPPPAYVLEEQFIVPGEELFVLGQVQQIAADGATQASYREATTLPTIGGSAEAQLVVYADSERSLLAAFKWEQRFLRFFSLAGLTLGLALAAMTLYLAAL